MCLSHQILLCRSQFLCSPAPLHFWEQHRKAMQRWLTFCWEMAAVSRNRTMWVDQREYWLPVIISCCFLELVLVIVPQTQWKVCPSSVVKLPGPPLRCFIVACTAIGLYIQTVHTKCWMKLCRWIAMHRVHYSPLYIEQFCRIAHQSFSHRCKCSCGCVGVGRWGEYVSIYVRMYVHMYMCRKI